MAPTIQDNLRFYQLLKWVQELNDGFGKPRQLDLHPATVSNLSAYMLDNDVMADRYPDDRRTNTFKFLKNHLNMLLAKYRVGGFVSRPEKVKQTESNHYALREGLASQGHRVYRYVLTKSGRGAIPSLEDYFEMKDQIARDHGITETDTVLIPDPDSRWNVTSVSVSRVNLDRFDIE